MKKYFGIFLIIIGISVFEMVGFEQIRGVCSVSNCQINGLINIVLGIIIGFIGFRLLEL